MNREQLIESVKKCEELCQRDKGKIIALIRERTSSTLDGTDGDQADTFEDVDHSSAFTEGTTPKQMEAFQRQHARSLQAYQRLSPELHAQTHFAYSETIGHWSMIGVDSSGNTCSWILNPQSYVLNNRPASMNWKKDGIVEHTGAGPSGEDIIHFNINGASSYVASQSSVRLASAPNTGYSSQFAHLLNISLTSWSGWSCSHGDLYHDYVGYCANLWIDQGYLDVKSTEAGVYDDSLHFGHSLLLSDVSLDT